MMIAVLFCTRAIAGGPFVVDMINKTGVVQQWDDKKMVWYVETGDLSDDVNNQKAREWIAAALEEWTTVTMQKADRQFVDTTAITTEVGGEIDKDITIANYADYVFDNSYPNTVVIFDQTGEITDDLVPGGKETVVGLSTPLLSSADGLRILKGVAIFNGYPLDQGTVSVEEYKGTIQHELGHLLNLDHSQVNHDVAGLCELGELCDYAQYIPTMYPELLTTHQASPHRDDIVAISWIYPTADFEENFCTITGTVVDADGNPLKGVNVYARRYVADEGGGTDYYGLSAQMKASSITDWTRVDVRSMVSGVLYPECAGDGSYFLHGIKPGEEYVVRYDAIGSSFTGASDFEPLENPPRGFDDGVIGEVVSCAQGGETITMPVLTIEAFDQDSNPCLNESRNAGDDDDDDDDDGADSKKLCGMAPGGIPSIAWMLLVAVLLKALLHITRPQPKRVRVRRRR